MTCHGKIKQQNEVVRQRRYAMWKRSRFVKIGRVVFASLCGFLLFCGTCFADDVRIVRISFDKAEGGHASYIQPDRIQISEGCVVVWLNEGTTDEVKVVFNEGTRCQDVTSGTSQFNLETACYLTTWVPVGGTTSLKFNEAGVLDYVVESSGGEKAEGKIIVRSPGWYDK